MTVHFRSPPVREVVAEVRFGPGPHPEATVAGLAYQALRESFPKVRAAVGITASFAAGPQGTTQQLVQVPRLQLLRDDERIVVQVAAHALSVHHVAPYSSWPEFSAIVSDVIRRYTLATELYEVQQPTLRYINRVALAIGESLATVFTTHPMILGEAPKLGEPFHLGIQRVTEAGVLIVEMTPDPQEANPGVVLDLRVIRQSPDPATVDSLAGWFGAAHDVILDHFLRAVSAEAQQRFNPES